MSQTKNNIDFSKFRIIPFEKKESNEDDEDNEELIFYKYSDIEVKKEEKKTMVNHYFFDDLNENDLKIAYIILFAGKTGAGKTTAINALFNIIKGVKLKDNYRFILIEEKKKTKRASRIANRWNSFILFKGLQ